MDIPAGYWIRAEERETTTLAVAIGNSDTDAQALGQIAAELGGLAQCIAWAYLELWEQQQRAMGETLRAILGKNGRTGQLCDGKIEEGMGQKRMNPR